MSTPFVAGLAGLVEQYFKDGYYPSGQRYANPTITPSGCLIKAVLINSATPLTGDITDSPNSNYGYGRPALAESLPLLTDEYTVDNLYVQDRMTLGHKSARVHTFKIPQSGTIHDFRVTMSWRETAGVVGSSSIVLNDLDLVVRYDNVDILGNYRSLKDSINNVEKVAIKNPQQGSEITVYVRGESIIQKTGFHYSLVVSGTFNIEKEPYTMSIMPPPAPPTPTPPTKKEERLAKKAAAKEAKKALKKKKRIEKKDKKAEKKALEVTEVSNQDKANESEGWIAEILSTSFEAASNNFYFKEFSEFFTSFR